MSGNGAFNFLHPVGIEPTTSTMRVGLLTNYTSGASPPPDSLHDSTEAFSLSFPYREVSDYVGLRCSGRKRR